MKLNRLFAVFVTLLILTLCGNLTEAAAQKSSKTKQVNLYFPKDGDSPDPQKNPSNLQPVKRKVNAVAPLRPALEALLDGPSAAEEQEGFSGLDVNGLYIVKVALKNGTAYAKFAHRKGGGFAGDIGPLIFGDAVERTLRQFPNVRRTVVCVDMAVNFGDESDGPVKKCPKF